MSAVLPLSGWQLGTKCVPFRLAMVVKWVRNVSIWPAVHTPVVLKGYEMSAFGLLSTPFVSLKCLLWVCGMLRLPPELGRYVPNLSQNQQFGCCECGNLDFKCL